MAKKSMVLRDEKRAKLVQRYAKKRQELKSIIASPKSRPEDKQTAQEKLQSLPRDSSPSRMRSRCAITAGRVATIRSLVCHAPSFESSRWQAKFLACARPAGKRISNPPGRYGQAANIKADRSE